jgi:hypothetical protein
VAYQNRGGLRWCCLDFKSVRLWSGLENGEQQEVTLHCAEDGHFCLQLSGGGKAAQIPVSDRDVRAILNSEGVDLIAPECECTIAPSGVNLVFTFRGIADVRFGMALQHFTLLAKSLSPAPTAS